MLQNIRKYANSLVVKLLLGLLIASFLIWGIGDFLRSGNKDYVAVIDGDNYISVIDFVEAKKRQLQQLKTVYPNITQDQVKSLNLNNMVLNQLITTKLLEVETRKLGILIDDGIALNIITHNPVFQNEEGKFDRELFKKILTFNNIPESDYVNQLKNELAVKMLTDVTSVQLTPGNQLVDAVNFYNNQDYIIDLISITADKFPDYMPKEDEINNFYNDNISNFTTAEYRDVQYITITPEQYKNKIKISEEEFQTELHQTLNHLSSNRSYDYYDIIFDSQELAQQAYEKLKQKGDFNKIVIELTGTNAKDYLVVSQPESDLSQNIANIVTTMKEKEISNVIKSDMGYHIIKLVKIATNKIDLGKLKQETKEQLVNQKIEQVMYDDIKKLEDEISSGKTLEEIAKNYQLPLSTILMITEQGKDNFDKEHNNAPLFVNFLMEAFKLPENQPSELLSIDDSSPGYYIVSTIKIYPAKQMPIDKVKAQIRKELLTKHKDLAANKMINELANKTKTTQLTEAMLSSGVTVTSITLPRPNESNQYNFTALIPFEQQLEIFQLNPAQHSGVFKTTKGDFAFAILKSIKNNPSKEISDLKHGLARSLSSNVTQEYMHYLEQKYKVTIHTEILSQIED